MSLHSNRISHNVVYVSSRDPNVTQDVHNFEKEPEGRSKDNAYSRGVPNKANRLALHWCASLVQAVPPPFALPRILRASGAMR
jgi:hypothetical protein